MESEAQSPAQNLEDRIFFATPGMYVFLFGLSIVMVLLALCIIGWNLRSTSLGAPRMIIWSSVAFVLFTGLGIFSGVELRRILRKQNFLSLTASGLVARSASVNLDVPWALVREVKVVDRTESDPGWLGILLDDSLASTENRYLEEFKRSKCHLVLRCRWDQPLTEVLEAIRQRMG